MKTIEKLPLFQEVTSNDSARVCGGQDVIVKATVNLTTGQINMEYEEQQGNPFPYHHYRRPYAHLGLGYGSWMGGYYF